LDAASLLAGVRHIANRAKADHAYGAGVRAALEALKPTLATAK